MSFDPSLLLKNPAELAKSYKFALSPKGGGAPVRVVQRITSDMKEVFDVWDMRPAYAGGEPKLVKAEVPDFEIALELADDYAYGRVKISTSPKVLFEGRK